MDWHSFSAISWALNQCASFRSPNCNHTKVYRVSLSFVVWFITEMPLLYLHFRFIYRFCRCKCNQITQHYECTIDRPLQRFWKRDRVRVCWWWFTYWHKKKNLHRNDRHCILITIRTVAFRILTSYHLLTFRHHSNLSTNFGVKFMNFDSQSFRCWIILFNNTKKDKEIGELWGNDKLFAYNPAIWAT